VCCESTCTLEADCDDGNLFIACNARADCSGYGGSWVCCEDSAGGETMRYCTKPSACNGTELP
jgi:hypothetical protein